LITEWYKSLEETPTAANNALQFLSSVFSYAQTLNLIDTNSNPASIIRKLNLTYPTIRRDRQIDLESELPKILYRLWDPMNTHTVNRVTRNAIYLLLISGLKKSDVLNLKWGQISNKKFIKFKRRNNIQVYPINEYIQDVLDDMENIYKGKKGFNFKKAEDWVFRSPKNPSKNINNLRKTLNIYSTDIDWVIYPESFRKTFAKVADLAGISRTHFYSLLGIKKPNYTYESIGSNNIHYNDLKRSLNKIHQAFDKLCPMQLPGIDQPLRHFMFNNNSNISML
jgi:integrase